MCAQAQTHIVHMYKTDYVGMDKNMQAAPRIACYVSIRHEKASSLFPYSEQAPEGSKNGSIVFRGPYRQMTMTNHHDNAYVQTLFQYNMICSASG